MNAIIDVAREAGGLLFVAGAVVALARAGEALGLYREPPPPPPGPPTNKKKTPAR